MTFREEQEWRDKLFNAKQEGKMAIVFAVAVEREACAKVAEELVEEWRNPDYQRAARALIAAIRARGEK